MKKSTVRVTIIIIVVVAGLVALYAFCWAECRVERQRRK